MKSAASASRSTCRYRRDPTRSCPLPQPLPIRFTVLEEKFVGRTVYTGQLESMSPSEAGIGVRVGVSSPEQYQD